MRVEQVERKGVAKLPGEPLDKMIICFDIIPSPNYKSNLCSKLSLTIKNLQEVQNCAKCFPYKGCHKITTTGSSVLQVRSRLREMT